MNPFFVNKIDFKKQFLCQRKQSFVLSFSYTGLLINRNFKLLNTIIHTSQKGLKLYLMPNQFAYIVEAVRSPLTKGRKDGAFSELHPIDLGTQVVKELVKRSKLSNPELVEDIIFGCATPVGEQGFNIARSIARRAIGISVPGLQVNRLCGSSAEAVDIGACKVLSGNYKLIISGGVESMSRIPMGADMLPIPVDLKTIWNIISLGKKSVRLTMPEDLRVIPMGISGEMIAEKYGFTRKELDEFSYESHMKAAKARDNGYFDREIVGVQTKDKLVKKDEGIRGNTTIEKMGTLTPAFKKDGVVTAANSSQITDGSAALLIANENAVQEYNLKPRAKIIKTHVVGSDPKLQLTGPIDAIPKILQKANLKTNDVDLFEINEAFALVVLATIKECGLDRNKVNVNGGAIALGHPLGASGARLLVTLLHELERRKLKRGLSVLCTGGGQATATIIELV